MRTKPALLSLAFLALAAAAHGGTVIEKATAPVDTTPFDQGRVELQISAGFFGLVNADDTGQRPQLNDVDGSVRVGWMLYSPEGSGSFRGNCEFLFEIYGGGIVEGPGSYLAGSTLIFRYNFVQHDARLVPYFQIQAGGVNSDVDDDSTQRLIGSDFSFHLGGALGVRFFCSDHCSVSLEANYRHISNAGLADRNNGANSLGGLLGVSWFF